MSSTYLTVRLTHKYTAGWCYMDKHFTVGSAEVLLAGTSPNSNVDAWTELVLIGVKTDKPYRQVNIVRAIHSTFSGTCCRHEHDCCGCVYTQVVEVEALPAGRYLVTLAKERNL